MMDDDDRTRLPATAQTVALVTATVSGAGGLPAGHRIAEFVIERLLGEGGFGVVYRALDTQLERTVAIKEYMPSSLARRDEAGSVTLRSERHRETFDLGLRSFINEARLLAAFDHPALVKVYRFWEENGTAYMVMPCYDGVTLKDWLRAQPHSATEAWWNDRLPPLLDALSAMHAQQCFHRDIAPDNILLVGSDLRLVLLDFGAARRVITDATQALTVILKPGYAPIEQYAEVATLRQGAWTDVYALCAVLYHSIAGVAPPPSVARVVKDECVPARLRGAGRYSEAFVSAIDAGLAVDPQDRPQDVRALSGLLGLGRSSAQPPLTDGKDDGTARAVPADSVQVVRAKPRLPVRLRAVVAAGGLMLVLGSLGAWKAGLFRHAAPAVPEPPVDARGPYQPLRAVEEVLTRADGEIRVSAAALQDGLTIGHDRLQFEVRSSLAGYVFVLFVGTDGRTLQMLFPNAIDQDNRIEPGQPLMLPRPRWRITASGPPGTDHVLVIVSPERRIYKDIGLTTPKGDVLGTFDSGAAERAWRSAAPGAGAVFAGEVDCGASSTRGCDRRYGAALLRIVERGDHP